MSCLLKVYKWSDEEEVYDFSYADWVFIDSETVTISNNCYTKPGAFDKYNFSPDTIIESSDGLTKKKVDAWCNHCNTYYSWKNQEASSAGEACRVSTGDLITVSWYNNCAKLCGASQISTTNPPLISADLINKLANFSA